MIYRKEVECTCCDRLAKFSLSFSLGTRSKCSSERLPKTWRRLRIRKSFPDFWHTSSPQYTGYLENYMTVALKTIQIKLILLLIFKNEIRDSSLATNYTCKEIGLLYYYAYNI